jgi:hypothetical protein
MGRKTTETLTGNAQQKPTARIVSRRASSSQSPTEVTLYIRRDRTNRPHRVAQLLLGATEAPDPMKDLVALIEIDSDLPGFCELV